MCWEIRTADGTSMAAEKVVSGSFPQLAATVVSVDAGAGVLIVKDLATKKNRFYTGHLRYHHAQAAAGNGRHAGAAIPALPERKTPEARAAGAAAVRANSACRWWLGAGRTRRPQADARSVARRSPCRPESPRRHHGDYYRRYRFQSFHGRHVARRGGRPAPGISRGHARHHERLESRRRRRRRGQLATARALRLWEQSREISFQGTHSEFAKATTVGFRYRAGCRLRMGATDQRHDKGVLMDDSGAVIPAAKVSLAAARRKQDRANAGGRQLYVCRPGSRELHGSASRFPGFATFSKQVTVNAGNAVQVPIQLAISSENRKSRYRRKPPIR